MRMRTPRRKLLKFGLLAAVFVAGNIAMIVTGDRSGWLGALFFGLCLAVFVVQLVSPSELLLTARGMQTTTLYRRSPFYEWRYCSNFHVWSFQTPPARGWRRFVVFDYAGPEIAKRPRLASKSRFLSGANSVLPDTCGLTGEELCRLIVDYQRAAMAAGTSAVAADAD